MQNAVSPLCENTENNLVVAHIADIHVKDKYRNVFAQVSASLFENLLVARPDIIVIAGDVFDDKSRASPQNIQDVSQFLSALNKIAPVILIAGNHDTNCATPGALDMLSPIVNVQGDLLPPRFMFLRNSGVYAAHGHLWTVIAPDGPKLSQQEERDRVAELVAQTPSLSNARHFCVFHEEVNGAKLPNGETLRDHALSMVDLKGYDAAFGGHIHKRQLFCDGRAAYCGSLVQQNFGESHLGHGFVLWRFHVDRTKLPSWEGVDVPNVYGSFVRVVVDETGVDVTETPVPERCASWEIVPHPLSNIDVVRLVVAGYKERFGIAPRAMCAARTRDPFLVEDNDDNGDQANLTTKAVADRIYREESAAMWEQSRAAAQSTQTQAAIVKDLLYEMGETDAEIIDCVLEKHKEECATKIENAASSGHRVRLLTMEFDDFYCFGPKNKVDFSALEGDVSGVVAPNASGKSYLIDVLLFALYGAHPRANLKSQMVRDGAQTCCVKLHFEIDGKSGCIVRSHSISGHKEVSTLRLEFDGKDLTQGALVTQKIAENLFGSVDSALWTTFRLQQQWRDDFVTCTAQRRKAALSDLLSLTDFADIEARVTKCLSSEEKSLAALRGAVSALESHFEFGNARQENLDAAALTASREEQETFATVALLAPDAQELAEDFVRTKDQLIHLERTCAQQKKLAADLLLIKCAVFEENETLCSLWIDDQTTISLCETRKRFVLELRETILDFSSSGGLNSNVFAKLKYDVEFQNFVPFDLIHILSRDLPTSESILLAQENIKMAKEQYDDAEREAKRLGNQKIPHALIKIVTEWSHDVREAFVSMLLEFSYVRNDESQQRPQHWTTLISKLQSFSNTPPCLTDLQVCLNQNGNLFQKAQTNLLECEQRHSSQLLVSENDCETWRQWRSSHQFIGLLPQINILEKQRGNDDGDNDDNGKIISVSQLVELLSDKARISGFWQAEAEFRKCGAILIGHDTKQCELQDEEIIMHAQRTLPGMAEVESARDQSLELLSQTKTLIETRNTKSLIELSIHGSNQRWKTLSSQLNASMMKLDEITAEKEAARLANRLVLNVLPNEEAAKGCQRCSRLYWAVSNADSMVKEEAACRDLVINEEKQFRSEIEREFRETEQALRQHNSRVKLASDLITSSNLAKNRTEARKLRSMLVPEIQSLRAALRTVVAFEEACSQTQIIKDLRAEVKRVDDHAQQEIFRNVSDLLEMFKHAEEAEKIISAHGNATLVVSRLKINLDAAKSALGQLESARRHATQTLKMALAFRSGKEAQRNAAEAEEKLQIGKLHAENAKANSLAASQKLESARSAHAAASLKLQSIKSDLDRCVKNSTLLEAKKDAMSKAERSVRILGLYRGILKPKNGIADRLLSLARRTVESEIRQAMFELGVSASLRIDESWNVNYESSLVSSSSSSSSLLPAHKRSILSGSGYELFAIGQAARLALWRLSSAPQIDALFIDEGFGACDDKHIDEIGEALTNVFCSKAAHTAPRIVFVVSHVEKLKPRIEHALGIVRDNKTNAATILSSAMAISRRRNNNFVDNNKFDNDNDNDHDHDDKLSISSTLMTTTTTTSTKNSKSKSLQKTQPKSRNTSKRKTPQEPEDNDDDAFVSPKRQKNSECE